MTETFYSPTQRPGLRTRRIPTVFFVLLFGLLMVGTFGMGFAIGRDRGERAAVPPGEGRVLNQNSLSPTVMQDVNFREFWDVWELMKEAYYRQPVSDKALYYGALKGLVSSMKDPYTVFFDPEESKLFQSALQGSFFGIGAEIGIRNDQLQIVAPLPKTPAEKAGLKSGDAILKINETETDNMTVEQAVMLIRGEKGTEVALTIYRKGEQNSREVKILRDEIVIESVKWEIKGDIGYLTVSTFGEDTEPLFQKAANEMLAAGVKGIVLDLRGDPGGLLPVGIKLASAWTGRRTVVIAKGTDGEQSYGGTSDAFLGEIPTVVLVDDGSASASEIMAGALQDYGLATLVGTKTFGKGSVQDYRELPDGSSVKITRAAWYTPSGRTIDKTGITPDEIVAFTQKDIDAKRDVQKEKALEILWAKIKK